MDKMKCDGPKYESHLSVMPSTVEVVFDKSVVEVRQGTIDRLLEDTKEKLKIALLMPHFYQNAKIVIKYLKNTEYQPCVELFVRVVNEHDRRRGHDDMECVIENDQQFMQLIEMFQQNYKLLECFPSTIYDNIDSEEQRLIDCLDQIQEISQSHLSALAIDELQKEKKLQKLYHDKQTMQKYIASFQSKLRNQQISMRWKFYAVDSVHQKKEEEILKMQQTSKLVLNAKMEEEASKMRKFNAQAKNRLEEAKARLEQAEENFERQLNTNQRYEQDLKREKDKLEIQLDMIIKKYDQTIGEKMKEKLYLSEDYALAKEQFEDFMEEYQKVEEAFKEMESLKNENDERNHREKVQKFIWNRAARIIQRAWRAFIKIKKREQAKEKKGKEAGKSKSKKK